MGLPQCTLLQQEVHEALEHHYLFIMSLITGHIKILQWLFSHGCSTVTDDLGGTPLHDSAEHGQLEVVTTIR